MSTSTSKFIIMRESCFANGCSFFFHFDEESKVVTHLYVDRSRILISSIRDSNKLHPSIERLKERKNTNVYEVFAKEPFTFFIPNFRHTIRGNQVVSVFMVEIEK